MININIQCAMTVYLTIEYLTKSLDVKPCETVQSGLKIQWVLVSKSGMSKRNVPS